MVPEVTKDSRFKNLRDPRLDTCLSTPPRLARTLRTKEHLQGCGAAR